MIYGNFWAVKPGREIGFIELARNGPQWHTIVDDFGLRCPRIAPRLLGGPGPAHCYGFAVMICKRPAYLAVCHSTVGLLNPPLRCLYSLSHVFSFGFCGPSPLHKGIQPALSSPPWLPRLCCLDGVSDKPISSVSLSTPGSLRQNKGPPSRRAGTAQRLACYFLRSGGKGRPC